MGILLVLGAAICLALQNIIIKLLFSQHEVWGFGELGGWVTPGFSHSLLLMQMRTLLMVGLLTPLSPLFYPATLSELKALAKPSHKELLIQSVVTGVFLFLSLMFLYLAISSATTGIAITLFFIHPAVTVMLAWWMFGDRPSGFRLGVVVVILVGIVLVTPYSSALPLNTLVLGTGSAIAAGTTFGAYNIIAQSCVQPQADRITCHPIPFSIVNFGVVLLLSTLCLPLLHVSIALGQWEQIWLATIVCAMATITAYVLNLFGIRLLGAATAALVGALNPVLTSLFAWLVIGETFGAVQAGGVLMVALGVASLSLSQFGRSPASKLNK